MGFYLNKIFLYSIKKYLKAHDKVNHIRTNG